MQKMGCPSRYLVAATCVAAAVAPASLLAGSRITPVAAMCPADARGLRLAREPGGLRG